MKRHGEASFCRDKRRSHSHLGTHKRWMDGCRRKGLRKHNSDSSEGLFSPTIMNGMNFIVRILQKQKQREKH
jgi:hypothetical protein